MYQLKASSLAESVLSLALVSVAIFISMMVFSNLFGSFYSRALEMEVLAKIDSIKIEIAQSPDTYLNEKKINFGNVLITTKLEEKNENLVLLTIAAENNGKEICDKKYLILNEEK